MGATRLGIALLWLGCLMPGSTPGQTLASRKLLGEYVQFIWQDQHGLPQNSANTIVRTGDGYLWLGTVDGLVRFDGMRFTAFDPINTPEIGAGGAIALLEDRAGDLWIATNGGGLTRRRGDRFTRYTRQDGLSNDHAMCLLEDRAGRLWVGTDGGGINLFQDGRFTTLTTKDGLPNDRVHALAEGAEGGLWIGTAGGLARYHDGRFSVYTTADGLSHNFVQSLCWDPTGQLWVGTYAGLSRLRDGRFTAFDERDGLPNRHVWAILRDREGNVWAGFQDGGLWRYREGRLVACTARDGLPSNQIRALYQDPEGDLWVGTFADGVSQLRKGRFDVYATAEGLPHDVARAIREDAAGSLWVGTRGGLSRFRGGKFRVWTTKDGLPADSISALANDRAGNLWVGSRAGLARLRDGEVTTWNTADGLSNDGIFSLLIDRADDLWIGTYGGGLNRFRDGRFEIYTTRDGLANDDLIALYEDRAGALWAGTRGGVSRFRDGRFTNWTAKDGLANDHVLSFYEDRWGGLWIGTHGGGLSRLKDGRLTTITTNDGLYDNLAYQILSDTEDDSGDLWMSGNRGIYRVSLKELNAFADGRISKVNSFAYGVADGMLSRACNGASPAGWKARDGRLWFPTTRGVVVIDPRRRRLDPPLVAIEGVTLEGAPLPGGREAVVRPGQGNLEIQYTGLSWSRPQQIRFRYQMAGLDPGWVEAGGRRTAYYSHLPPGSYTFRVIADNGEGVWNMGGRSLRVVVLPPFYRTWWFIALAAIGIVAAFFLAFRYRVEQLRRRHEQQQAFSRQLIESQESERKRIAAELHDSLGQNLLVIKNRALLGALTQPHEGARTQFNEISQSVAQTLEEVRTISYNLRPSHLDQLGLRTAFVVMIEKVAASSEVRFTSAIDELDGLLPPGDEIIIYRIVQESINNILKHARATEAHVEITRRAHRLEVTVRDNGRGFAVGEAGHNGHGGFGLTGIAERVRMLGGTHSIQSAPGQGTTVTVTLDIGQVD